MGRSFFLTRPRGDGLALCDRKGELMDDPGPDVVFFSAWRTVSVLIESTRPGTTISSARSRRVQWHRLRGGSVQAS